MSSEINFSGNVQNVLTGDINNSTVNINSQSGQERTLSEAAAEIQLLLKQLEKDNPGATSEETTAWVNEKIDLQLKDRLLNAFKSGSKTAIEELLDNPYLSIAIGIIEGWNEGVD